eukprot:CAMPEP_0172539346 /NCGR_PEP_ID=MMETSP1067-20121228/10552_1 /TAXON_ID=265564 ORGANISM="Thalassiosira punctigera, Strain Tpunct2005C2" /NCGR_SAMPLE_ID=MMETSP1067 /ASSEMBLY_ACC=CAM_ASM_000444 /LENGTH=611 /DNA_ID=CAMNT_0013325017 /DNA_START=111 /DNA_END=1946 /DNA_ORIENTATION=-
MTSSPFRRLDFSGQTGVLTGASSDADESRSRRQSGLESAAQHPFRQNVTSSVESAQRNKRSTFSPASSSPQIRNTLSSHASEMGRRLAQERFKNYELIQKIRELECTVSLLKEGKHDDVTYVRPCFSSPPVASPARRGLVDSPEKRDLQNMNGAHGPELENGQRETSEKQSPKISGSPDLNNIDSSVIASDPSIVKLLEQASKLLSGKVSNSNGNKNQVDRYTTNSQGTRSHQPLSRDGSAGPTHVQERMREYHELVTAFHSEHESHGDIDGEEMISREDILWLFQELKWRFEEILNAYTFERSMKKDDPTSDNEIDWKECLESLAKVVKKSMKPPPFHETILQKGDERIDEPTLPNDSHDLQSEVSSLNQRLASFAAQHKETCRALYDDMEAMKRDFLEKIAIKSHCIQNLETKISEQEEYIAQIQKEAQKDKQWIKEEKRKLKLSKEGTSARIRYLEGMLWSLQVELKEMRTPERGNNNSTPIRNYGTGMEKEREILSPPVFMRDLTSAMQDVDRQQHEEDLTANALSDQAKDGRDTQKGTPPLECAEMTKLLDQIASMGDSLAESETQRADLLDDFQAERKTYVLQYKQMSDILKYLIKEERMNHTQT